MASREVHLELLLGKEVLDSTGQEIGRLEEVQAKQSGEDWVIYEYLVGPAARLERLSAWALGLAILRLFGAHKVRRGYKGYRVPWDQLDLTNPEKLRLNCSLDELKTISEKLEAED